MSDPVRLTRLPGGLTILSETMARVETVSVGAYIATGTRHEPAECNGISHFLEHMAFKGTPRRDAAAIARAIEDVGGHLNAYTAREQTAFYAKVLKEDLGLAVDVIGDILTHASFPPEEIERERGVILQEIGQANDTPDDIVFDRFQETAYPDQPMGRPVLGTEATIQAISRETLLRHRHSHYGAKRMVIAAAGAVDHGQLVDLVRRHFADLPPGTETPPEPARYRGGEFREARDLDQVHIVLGFPAVAYTDPLHHAVQLLATLLGGGMSSRLFLEIREKRGLVYAIHASAAPFRDHGLFEIYAGTGEEEAAELIPLLIEALRAVQEEVTAEELTRAKAQLRASLLMSLESTGHRCEQLARQWHIHGRVIPFEELRAKIDAVSRDQVRQAAARLFRAPPTLAVLGPARKVPPLAAIAEQLAA